MEEEKRLKKLITLVGEFGEEEVPGNLNKLIGVTKDSIVIHKEFIMETITNCVTLIPHKSMIYASYGQLIHASLVGFMEEFLVKLVARAQENVTASKDREVKNAVRFLSDLVLVGVLEKSGFVAFIEGVVAEGSDFWQYVLFSTLPYIGINLPLELVDRILGLAREPTIHKPASFLDLDVIEALRQAAQRCKSTNWEGFIPKPYLEAQEGEKIEKIPELTPGEPVFQAYYPFTSDPSTLDVIAYEVVVDMLRCFELSAEITIDKILLTSIPPMVVLSAILGELFVLPEPQARDIYYSAMILKLTQATSADAVYISEWEIFAQIVLSKISEIDFECQLRFAKLLAHFIGNKDFTWGWQFIAETGTPDFHKLLLNKLHNLSYLGRLKEVVPPVLYPHLPLEPDPLLKFTQVEDSVDNTDCQLIIDRINSRANPQNMKTLLFSKEICNSGDTLNLIFIQCLLFQGGKTLTHTVILFERYKEILGTLKPELILEGIFDVWRDSPHQIRLIAEKMVVLEILTIEQIFGFMSTRETDILEWEITMDFLKFFPECKTFVKENIDSATWKEEKIKSLKRHL